MDNYGGKIAILVKFLCYVNDGDVFRVGIVEVIDINVLPNHFSVFSLILHMPLNSRVQG